MLGTIPYKDGVSLYDQTRLKRGRLGTMTKPTGGGTTQLQLNPTGLLRGVQLQITAVVNGTPDAANALGMCAAIRGVRLRTNSSTMIYDTSGAGYTYGVNEMLNTELAVGIGTTYNQGASAVAAGTFRLDMYLPVAMNWRDPIGLFLLQNREINVQIEIDWEADTVLTGGATATYTATCLVIPEWFTVPDDPALMPPLNLIHQITEETRVISGSGDINYQPLTGQIYLGIAYGAYWAQSAADGFNRFQEIVGASDYWQDETVGSLDVQNYLQRGRNRRAGTIIRDFMATAGLGMLSQTDRDVFDTLNVTNFQHVITATGAGTLRIVRRQLVRVNMN
jgi:hypothetical protein